MPIEKLFQELGRLHLEVMHLQEQLAAAKALSAIAAQPPAPDSKQDSKPSE
jgi:hypothetical protein